MASASYAARLSPAAADRPAGVGRWIAALAAVVALALLGAWWLGWFGAAVDPRVAEIQKLREELAAKYPDGRGPANLVEATAMATDMYALRQKIEALPEDLRPQAERGGGSMFRNAMRARIDAYFTAPPPQREAVLDRQIDEMEIMRKAFEAAEKVTAAFGGGGASNGGGGSGGGAGAGAAAPPPGGPMRSTNEEERNKFRKGIIDRTSPAERARYVEYWRAVGERREQRGLPPMPWGR
jgi:hypothetical protein